MSTTAKSMAMVALIIDSDATEAARIGAIVEAIPDSSITAVVAANLEGARMVLKDSPVDLALLAYGENGIRDLGLLRSTALQLPIIAVVATGDEETAVSALEAGAGAYLSRDLISTATVQCAILSAFEIRDMTLFLEIKSKTLKKINNDLRQRNRQIANFYQSLSLDLKATLTSAIDFLALVRDDVAGELNDDHANYLAIVNECLRLGSDHIDTIRDITRIEAGSVKLVFEPTDLRPVVQRAIHRQINRARFKKITIDWDVPEDLPKLDIVLDRFDQVLDALLDHAIRFTSEMGTIRLTACEEGDNVLLTVSEKGCDFPPESLDIVWDRLFRVREPDPEENTGIGLSLCRELVRLHNGKMSADSDDTETTFYLSFPKSSAAESPTT